MTMQLPASPDAERSVLGAVLLDNAAMTRVTNLSSEEFSHDAHRRLWRHFAALAEDGRPIDDITLTEELLRTKELEVVGGVRYLSELTAGLPRSVNVAHYAAIVKEKARLRKLIATSNVAMRAALDNEEASEIISRLEMSLAAMRESETTSELTDYDEVPGLEAVRDMPVFWLVDDIVARGDLVYFIGKPASYKSTFVLDMVRAIAQGGCFIGRTVRPQNVLYLDGENPEATLAHRKRILAIGSHEHVPGLRYWGRHLGKRLPSVFDKKLLDWTKANKPLLVFDSFIRFIELEHGSLNNSEDVARMNAGFMRLASAGAGVIVIHHASSKSGAEAYAGSFDLEAGADTMWIIEREKPSGRVDVRSVKHRLGMEFSFAAQLEQGGFAAAAALDGTASTASVFTRRANA